MPKEYVKTKETSVTNGFWLPETDQRGVSFGYMKPADFNEASKYIDSQVEDLSLFGRFPFSRIVEGGTYLFGSGTVSAPAMAFFTDPDTGFYSVGAGQIGVSINGVNEATFNSSGLAIADMTLGSVLFAGASGQISQNNASFFWDNTLFQLSLIRGDAVTATPSFLLNQTSTGDIYQRFTLGAGNSFALGIDNSDSDSFKLSYNAAGAAVLGTNDYITITTGGMVTIPAAATSIDLTNTTANAGGSIRFGSAQSIIYDGANQTGLRNGTNAQTLRIFNTFTAGTPDFESLNLSWAGNVATIGTGKGGTGTARTLSILQADGSTAWTIPAALGSAIALGTPTPAATVFANGIFRIANAASYTRAGAATCVILQIDPNLTDSGTNSAVTWYVDNHKPTINYSAGSKTGKVYELYMNPTATSLPTGQNGGLVFSSAHNVTGLPAIVLNNVADEDTNYEKGIFQFISNKLVINNTIGGAGTQRTTELQIAGAAALTVGTANEIAVSQGSNAQNISIERVTELTTIAAAATTDTAIQIPVDAVVFAVSVRVTVAIPTAVTFTVTGTTSGTQFDVAGGVAVAANTTDVGTRNCPYKNGAAQTIRITPSGVPANNNGRVRVTIHYYKVTVPTS